MEENTKNGSDSVRYKRKKNTPNTASIETIGSKVPPHSSEAEIAVLGAMMLSREAISRVCGILDEDSFYFPAHKVIFNAMTTLNDRGTHGDILTLKEYLRSKNQLEEVGGTYYLSEINAKTPTAANVENHARIVQERYLKRCLIDTAGQILANAYDESTDALEEIDKAESDIFKIAEKRLHKSYVDIKSLAHDTYDLISRLSEKGSSGLTGVPTGFIELDKMLGGLQNSDLIIVAARPSMGKTAFALSMARNAALIYEHPVAVFSLEMTSIQLVMRLLSAESRINQSKLRTGMISSEDNSKIISALGKLADAKIFIDDTAGLPLMELRAKCRRLKAEQNIKLVIIDYLQLIHAPKTESREREISIISQSLKNLAKELNIPVVALAQLNRGVEGRTDKRPMLSDLRESGSIEQDADVVMFVNRPEYYKIQKYDDGSATENTAEIIVGKQRNGEVGTRRLAFLKDFARFENLALDHGDMNYLPEQSDKPNF